MTESGILKITMCRTRRGWTVNIQRRNGLIDTLGEFKTKRAAITEAERFGRPIFVMPATNRVRQR